MSRSITTFLTATAVALIAISGTSSAAARVHAAFVDGVWINGKVHNLATGPGPAAPKHVIPLYVIAPVSASHPLHPLAFAKPLGFGAHDHVAQIPDPSAGYNGACDLTLVVPGPKAKLGTNVEARRTLTPAASQPLLHAARLSGAMSPLNWAARIRSAQHLGLAKLIDTKVVIACTIAPKSQG